MKQVHVQSRRAATVIPPARITFAVLRENSEATTAKTTTKPEVRQSAANCSKFIE